MTPQAASETVTNSVTWNDVNIEDGLYYIIWDGDKCAIPLGEGQDFIFEVETENFGEITTGVALVYDKMARVNRNNSEKDKKANYNGTIVNGKLNLVDKERVM